MKKLHTLLLMMAAVLSLSLTSCDDDYYYGPGYNYDSDLIGTWELFQANGYPVTGYDVNWIEFYRNGNGTYYYYDHGQGYEMDLRYDVDFYYSTSKLYISYADGSNVTADYWFNNNRTYLYMSWYSGSQPMTYVYRYVNSVDWAPALTRAASPLKYQPGDTLPSGLLMPGLTVK